MSLPLGDQACRGFGAAERATAGTWIPILATAASVVQICNMTGVDFCETASGKQQEMELESCLFCCFGTDGEGEWWHSGISVAICSLAAESEVARRLASIWPHPARQATIAIHTPTQVIERRAEAISSTA